MTTIDSMDSNRIYFVSVVVFAFKIACEGGVLEGKSVCIPVIMKEKINIKNCSKSLNKKSRKDTNHSNGLFSDTVVYG